MNRGWVRWFREVGAILLLVAVSEYFLVPRLVEARSEIALVWDMSIPLLMVAVAFECASLVAYTCSTQVILGDAAGPLPFGTQLRVDLTGYGVSHVVPGGGATAAALRYRLMVVRGVDPAGAVSLTAVQTLVSVVALLAVTALAGLVAIPRTGLTTATAVFVSLTVVAGLGMRWLRAAPSTAAAREWLKRMLPARWREPVTAVLASVVRQLRQASVRRQGFAWAGSNWMLDAGCLWVCLWAYGEVLPPELVLAAYGLACLVGSLPLTPGGIGVIEGLLVPALLLAGGSSGETVLGVLTWRLLQYWLPIPVAAACWLSLRVGSGRPGRAEGFVPPVG